MVKAEKNNAAIAGSHPAGALREGQNRVLGPNNVTGTGSPQPYSGDESSGQLSDSEQRPSEEDLQRAELGPRGEPGKDSPAKMTPQRENKTPNSNDPGHTA